MIVRPIVENGKVSMEDQLEYWSGVGMLLYLVKHLCPNLANTTRELSKENDDANLVAYKKYLQVIQYDLDTESLGLKIEPMGNSNNPWEMICFSDSNYAGDLVSRRSIIDFLLYVLGLPVSWRSKLNKSVSLSSSETEYIALSEAVKKAVFVLQLLGSMKILVKYPVMVRVDNIGAIFMANNIMTTSHTKHMDTRYKYVNEYVDDGIV